ncbi:MAG: hypothetical protein HQM06_04875 [Magnetococcales bacterium]|nr:hypothetical protein [Magnetococcales bacterium]
MMKTILQWLWRATFFYSIHMSLPGCLQAGEIVVIINPENLLANLSQAQVSDLYLGRTRTFPDGNYAQVIEQTRASAIRQRFYHTLNGMSLNQVNAYWARLAFSGRVQPPDAIQDDQEVLKKVTTHRTAIGYIDSSQLNDSVKEVLRLRD